MDANVFVNLDPQREYALSGAPDKYRFAENYMVAIYDPHLDLGLWLHLGTCPDDFTQWEEQVLMALPGDGGFLWTRAYSRPEQARKPAGANLAFEVIEPFHTMRVVFDGIGIRTPYAEMLRDRVRDGRQELFTLDLVLTAAAPAWDNKVSAESGKGRGSMAEQAWASDHYQQTFTAKGTIRVDGKDLAFNGTGVRDHSRGQRGHKPFVFGGHNLWSAPFPSGRAFGMQRMWLPNGEPSLEVAFVYLNGEFHHCDVVSPPAYLMDVKLGGDALELILRSARGDHKITGRVRKTMFCTFGDPWGYYFGADQTVERGLFAPALCEWQWDGETSYGLCERSGPVGGPR